MFVPHSAAWLVQRKWKDHPRRKLETQLNKVMLGLRAIAAGVKESRRRLEAYSQRVDAFHQRRADLEEEVEREREAVEKLEADVDAWRRAGVIRDYVAVVEAQAATPTRHGEVATWAEWARQQADRLDPLVPSPPSILDTPEDQYRELEWHEILDEDGNIEGV